MEAYFDNAATTKIDVDVKNLVVKLMETDYGNPSSLHTKGVEAGNYIRRAKEQLAHIMKVDEKEIYFTSGGTESNNLAILGAAFANRRAGNKIVTTRIEHASVLSPMKFLSEQGFEVCYLDVDQDGRIDLEQLKEIVDDRTILVSMMYVNNEIGAVEPVHEAARIIKDANPGTLVHVDAIQAFGKYVIYPKRMGIDLMSISGHKFHGPKGTGALFIKDRTKIRPVLYGGGQQKGLRSGTENVPGYAGMALAAELAYKNLDVRMSHIRQLKERLISRLLELENVWSNSGEAPHIASITFGGIRSEVMLHALEERGIYVSAGSACSSNKQSESSTLKAIGLSADKLGSTLRFSFSYENTMEEVDYAVEAVKDILPMLRKYVRKK